MMDGEAADKFLGAIARPEIHKLGDEQQIGIIPEGMNVVDLSQYLPPPSRVEQRVSMQTAPSFCDYIKRFSGPESTIFADEVKASYVCVLDYHGGVESVPAGSEFPTKRRRGTQDHVVTFACPVSEEYARWNANNGKWLDQYEFAKFIEENLRVIIAPSGADMLQMALNLQVHKGASFKSEQRLENGEVKFVYEEDIRGSTKVGDLSIPPGFTIAIPVFIDSTIYKVACRFRYRLNANILKLSYEIEQLHDLHRDAVKAVTKQIEESLPGTPLYRGARG